MNDLSTELREQLIQQGASLVGFADLRGIAPEIRDGLPYGVSIAIALNPKIISQINNGPTQVYYAEYGKVNAALNDLGHFAADFLQKQGKKVKWMAASEVGIDNNTLTTKLPHKTVATRAGLGWIGKTALLVTKQFGSAVRITSVLTDQELPVGTPIDLSLCGTCTECVDTCPAHAASGKNWEVNKSRDSFFDAFACRKTAREIAETKLGIRSTICGLCIWACPWTQKYLNRTLKNAC